MSQIPPPPGQVPPSMSYQSPPPGAQANQGLAIGSLICGIGSLVLSIFSFCLWFLSFPLGVVAVVLGFIAKGKAARGEAGGAGLAKAGLITGAIGILLSVIIPLALYAGLSTAGKKLQEEAERQQRLQQQEQGTSQQ